MTPNTHHSPLHAKRAPYLSMVRRSRCLQVHTARPVRRRRQRRATRGTPSILRRPRHGDLRRAIARRPPRAYSSVLDACPQRLASSGREFDSRHPLRESPRPVARGFLVGPERIRMSPTGFGQPGQLEMGPVAPPLCCTSDLLTTLSLSMPCSPPRGVQSSPRTRTGCGCQAAGCWARRPPGPREKLPLGCCPACAHQAVGPGQQGTNRTGRVGRRVVAVTARKGWRCGRGVRRR